MELVQRTDPNDALPALVDLDALVQPVGRVHVGGADHDVLPLDGISYDAVLALNDGAGIAVADQLALARRVVTQCVPTLSAAIRQRLNLEQLTRLLAIAGRAVDGMQLRMGRAAGKVPGPRTAKRRGATPPKGR